MCWRICPQTCVARAIMNSCQFLSFWFVSRPTTAIQRHCLGSQSVPSSETHSVLPNVFKFNGRSLCWEISIFNFFSEYLIGFSKQFWENLHIPWDSLGLVVAKSILKLFVPCFMSAVVDTDLLTYKNLCNGPCFMSAVVNTNLLAYEILCNWTHHQRRQNTMSIFLAVPLIFFFFYGVCCPMIDGVDSPVFSTSDMIIVT